MTRSIARPARILITGAAGFVGRHLLERLAHAWPEATVCATSKAASARTSSLDVTDAAAAAEAIADFHPDAVVHLAAVSAVPRAQRAADVAWRVNFDGARNIGSAVLQRAPSATLLFVSSATCYGRTFRSGAALAETAPLEPNDTYAATKAAAEMALVAMCADGLKLIRVRPFNHVGPGQAPAFAIASFALQIARIEAGLTPPPLAVGSLDPRRDFLDVRDVCRAYVLCLERREELEPGLVINLASGSTRRVGDVLDELLAQARLPIPVESESARRRKTDVAIMRGDPRLAARLLGWKAEIPWPQTLADILAASRARVAGASGSSVSFR